MVEDCKLLIGVGSNSILGGGGGGEGGGGECNIHCDVAICAACMNINKVSRVKYWGALAPPALPPPPTPNEFLCLCY